jgi:hypothetical protein
MHIVPWKIFLTVCRCHGLKHSKNKKRKLLIVECIGCHIMHGMMEGTQIVNHTIRKPPRIYGVSVYFFSKKDNYNDYLLY